MPIFKFSLVIINCCLYMTWASTLGCRAQGYRDRTIDNELIFPNLQKRKFCLKKAKFLEKGTGNYGLLFPYLQIFKQLNQNLVYLYGVNILTIVFYTCIPGYYNFSWRFCNAEHSDAAITANYSRQRTYNIIEKDNGFKNVADKRLLRTIYIP